MAYSLPTLQFLKELLNELKVYHGTNTQRTSFIALYKHILNHVDSEKTNILLYALIIYEIEAIASEYNFLSPERSEIYALLTKKLKSEKCYPITDHEILFHLAKLYKYIEHDLSDELIKNLHWRNKGIFLSSIKELILQILKKQTPAIQKLLRESSHHEITRKEIEALVRSYRKETENRWFGNKSRDALIMFIEFINEMCNLLQKKENYVLNEELQQLQDDINNDIRTAAFLFALIKINREYSYLSPERSSLYESILKKFGVTNLNEIPANKKIAWLQELLNFLNDLENTNAVILDDWEKKGLIVHEWKKEVKHYLYQEQGLKNLKSTESTALVKTSYALQYGVGLAFSHLASNYVLTSLGALVLGGATGPVGLVAYGVTGTIISFNLFRLVKEKLIPEALAILYTQILEKIGESIGGAAAGAFVLTFSLSNQGLHNLLRFYESIETNQAELIKNKTWLAALRELDGVFPEEQKNMLEKLHRVELKPTMRASI